MKTSLLPQFQMQIVLYGSAPMLLFIICFLVHLCILMGNPVTLAYKKWLPFIYAAPFGLWLVFLMTKDHHELYNIHITDGRSPLDPLFLQLTITFVAGYILLSVLLLAVFWYRTTEAKPKKILRSLLFSLFALFAWFVLITLLLQTGLLTTRNAMILYFIGYLLWAIELRHLIGKHDIMPDYRKLFHVLFKSAPTGILLVDKKGSIIEMNPRAVSWFEGISVDDLSRHLFMKKETTFDGLLSEVARHQYQGSAAHWEIQMASPTSGLMDFMAGIDVIEGTNEDLFVIHLTDVTALKETERRLMVSEQSYKHIAHHDSLTDLYNRAAIQEQLEQKVAGSDWFAFILIDLDNFKPVNDNYGHLVGDYYLKHIAHVFKSYAQPGDLIGRIGGDEFVLVLACSENIDIPQMVQQRLSQLNNTSFNYMNVEIPVSFSAGVSVFPETQRM
ncbi:sensor domain-containing diguanylate cyclase [Paenibacillus lacisoli]|nr:diguanylate cyclase [Paenibacillus sp. JX-17]